MNPLLWATALLLAAVVLCFLEVFIPSMGVITLIAVGCAIGSCVIAFNHSVGWGAAFVPLNVVGIAVSFAVAFKLLPKSPLAMSESDVETATNVPAGYAEGLRGASGVAFTDLRPGGTAMIGDRKVDVIAEGGYVDEGTKIRVVKVEGSKVVVGEDSV